MATKPVYRCEELKDVEYINFGVSLFLLIGMLLSYLPQHYRIVTRGSSYGMSPYFVLLGMTSATSALANILVLPGSRADVACCRVIGRVPCFAALLGIAQMAMQWLCFGVIMLLFLIFFPRASNYGPNPDVEEEQPRARSAVIVVLVCVLHAAILAAISLYIVIDQPDSALAWAGFLGISAAALAAIQYFPQIWTTYKIKAVASLSIPMMCVQTPGAFVWAGSLAARLGVEGWSTWGIYVLTGALQGTLLVMGIYYEWKRRGTSRTKEPESEGRETRQGVSSNSHQHASEETPLLRSEG